MGVPQSPQLGPPEPDLRPARPVSTDTWEGFTGVTAEVGWPRHEGTVSGPALAGDRPPLCPLFRGGSLVDNIYRGLVLYPFSQSLSFGWGIQPIYI